MAAESGKIWSIKSRSTRPLFNNQTLQCMQKTAYCSRNFHAGPGMDGWQIRLPAKMLRIMKLTTILMLLFCLHLSARTSSQTISLTGKDLPLKTIFTAIERQTGYLVWGKAEFLEHARPVTISVRDMPLNNFLALVLDDQPFTWKISDNTIILSEKAGVVIGITPYRAPVAAPVSYTIAGFLQNVETKEPISGASITFKGSAIGVSTDASGRFVMGNIPENAVMIISCP